MKNSLFLVILVAALLFTSLPTINLVIAQEPPIAFMVEPDEYYALKKDETFTTNITLNNVNVSQRLVGIEFRLGYNDTLLEVVGVTEGPFFAQFNQTSTPPATFFVYFLEPKTTGPNGTIPAHIIAGLALMPNATGGWPGPMPEGNGTIVQVTFRAIYQPVEPDIPVNCTLDLFNATALDDSRVALPIEEIDGYYEIAAKPPIAFMVEPDEYYALKKDETFTTNITLNNVYAAERLVAVEFRLGYNDTLLEVVGVTEGPFFAQFNQTSTPPATFFVYFLEPKTTGPNGTIPAHVVVGILLMPNATGGWPGPMPEGNGTIVQVTFRAIYQPVEPDIPVNCTLDLFNATAVDDLKTHLRIAEMDGFYEIIEALYPIPMFTYTPSKPTAGQEVTFNATESYDPDGSIVWYFWEFEDGTTINTTNPVTTHIFHASGIHDATLTIKDIDGLTSTITKTIEIGAYVPIDVEVDTSPMYFRGEICEYNILTTILGRAVNADVNSAVLYFNGSIYANLTGSISWIDTGLYQIQYTVPGTAEAGTYTLIIDAEYAGRKGMSMISFYVSDNIAGIKSAVDNIQQDMLTLLTDTGIIRLNLTEIQATAETIDGTTAVISSNVGDITVDIQDLSDSVLVLDGKVDDANTSIDDANTSIDDANANIDDIGETQASILTMQYVTLALALIAIIAAAMAAFFARKAQR